MKKKQRPVPVPFAEGFRAGLDLSRTNLSHYVQGTREDELWQDGWHAARDAIRRLRLSIREFYYQIHPEDKPGKEE